MSDHPECLVGSLPHLEYDLPCNLILNRCKVQGRTGRVKLFTGIDSVHNRSRTVCTANDANCSAGMTGLSTEYRFAFGCLDRRIALRTVKHRKRLAGSGVRV